MGNYTTLARMAGRASVRRQLRKTDEQTVLANSASAFRCGNCGDTSVVAATCEVCAEPMLRRSSVWLLVDPRPSASTWAPAVCIVALSGSIATLFYPWSANGMWGNAERVIGPTDGPWTLFVLLLAAGVAVAALAGLIAIGVWRSSHDRRVARRAGRLVNASPALAGVVKGERGRIDGTIVAAEGKLLLVASDSPHGVLELGFDDASRAFTASRALAGIDEGRARVLGTVTRGEEKAVDGAYRSGAVYAGLSVETLVREASLGDDARARQSAVAQTTESTTEPADMTPRSRTA